MLSTNELKMTQRRLPSLPTTIPKIGAQKQAVKGWALNIAPTISPETPLDSASPGKKGASTAWTELPNMPSVRIPTSVQSTILSLQLCLNAIYKHTMLTRFLRRFSSQTVGKTVFLNGFENLERRLLEDVVPGEPRISLKRNFCFLEYTTSEQAGKAIDELNGKEVGNQILRARMATNKAESSPHTRRTDDIFHIRRDFDFNL